MCCDWSKTLFLLIISKGWMQVSFINMSANFKWVDYFLKTKHRNHVFCYINIGRLFQDTRKAEKTRG